jgi:hypothetical protein
MYCADIMLRIRYSVPSTPYDHQSNSNSRQTQFIWKKPWEIPHLDTLELWKFGDYKHTSLKLMCKVLPSLKVISMAAK